MKIQSVTNGRHGQTVTIEGTSETFLVKKGFDISRFAGRDVKSLFVNRDHIVVGVEHTNGTVTGERS